MNRDFQALIQELHRTDNLLLVGHEDPDCDCLSTMLALYLAFDGRNRGWQMLRRDIVPANLHYLPALDEMIPPEEANPEAEAVLLVDCHQVSRTGSWLEPMLPGKKLLCLDHHAGDQFIGDVGAIYPQAAAAAELAGELICQAGIEPDPEVALCLYSGLMADTGGFRFRNVTPNTLELAARLLPLVDTELIRIQLFEARTWANMRMLAEAFQNMQVECDGRLCYTWLGNEQRERCQAGPADCHNIVNETLTLSGVQVGLIFEEYSDYVKMSFRSRKGWDVDQLAIAFGGGGHAQASGCKIKGDLAQVMPIVLEKTRAFLNSK